MPQLTEFPYLPDGDPRTVVGRLIAICRAVPEGGEWGPEEDALISRLTEGLARYEAAMEAIEVRKAAADRKINAAQRPLSTSHCPMSEASIRAKVLGRSYSRGSATLPS